MTSLPNVTIELIPDTEHGGFTAHISDIPVYGEGVTEEEAMLDLKEGLQGYIDLYGMEETVSHIAVPSHIRHANLAELVHG